MIALTDIGYDEAESIGLFEANGSWELRPGGSWVGVVAEGLPGAKEITLTDQASAEAVIELEITGIRSTGHGAAVAEFAWTFSALPDQVVDYARQGSHGTASLLKYDDGWRVEELPMIFSDQPYPPSATKQAALDTLATAKRNSVRDLLGNMMVMNNGILQTRYALHGTWFEFAQGTANILIVVHELNEANGTFKALLVPRGANGPNARGMRILHQKPGFLDGTIDWSDFTIRVGYSEGVGNPKTYRVEPVGPTIVGNITLTPHFDDAGSVIGWETMNASAFGGLNGSLQISNRKFEQ